MVFFFFKKGGKHQLLRSWPSNVCSAAANQVGYKMRMTTKRRKEEVKISMTTRDSRSHDSHAVPLVCRIAILLHSSNDAAAVLWMQLFFVFANRTLLANCRAASECFRPTVNQPPTPSAPPWRMNEKCSGNSFLLGFSSLANHGG
jgi:hypothetical protein